MGAGPQASAAGAGALDGGAVLCQDWEQRRVLRRWEFHPENLIAVQVLHRAGSSPAPPVHDETLTTEATKLKGGTDPIEFRTRLEGTSTVFVFVNHFAV